MGGGGWSVVRYSLNSATRRRLDVNVRRAGEAGDSIKPGASAPGNDHNQPFEPDAGGSSSAIAIFDSSALLLLLPQRLRTGLYAGAGLRRLNPRTTDHGQKWGGARWLAPSASSPRTAAPTQPFAFPRPRPRVEVCFSRTELSTKLLFGYVILCF